MNRIVSKTNAIAFAATLLFAFSARADLNLFDLIRDGKHRYALNENCKSFFKQGRIKIAPALSDVALGEGDAVFLHGQGTHTQPVTG